MSSAELTMYAIDPTHSHVGFSIRHLMLTKVRGEFRSVSGAIGIDRDSNLPARIEAEIAVDSIMTGEAQRDGHLKSADFFAAQAHPTISFRATNVEAVGTGFVVSGDLAIRGTTRSIKLEGELIGTTTDPWGKSRAGFEAKTRIDRRDFGLVWNQALETGGVMLGEHVDIELQIQAVRVD
jgi:polyisoprenoid-binding protein YceI